MAHFNFTEAPFHLLIHLEGNVMEKLLRSAASRREILDKLGQARAPLATLAQESGTDKVDGHEYIAAYERFFSEYRDQPITLLEIGVGGANLFEGGNSLDLWEAYFQRGTIVGIDVYDKTNLSHGRVHVHQCSQTDREGLERIAAQYSGFDLIIDDGSHVNEHQIESFRILFPLLKTPGVYVIEDTETSYWPAFGGGSPGTQGCAASATGFFKALIDGLNHAEWLPSAQAAPSLFQSEISAIHFEHSLIAVLKGDNSAKSSYPIHLLEPELEKSRADSTGMFPGFHEFLSKLVSNSTSEDNKS